MKLIYHAGYDLNLGAHVFPSQKYRLIRDRLANEGLDFLTPEPAADEDLLRVHGRGWITRLKQGTLHEGELLQRLEIPWSQKMADAFCLAAGGNDARARAALCAIRPRSTSAADSIMRSPITAKDSAPSTTSRLRSASCNKKT